MTRVGNTIAHLPTAPRCRRRHLSSPSGSFPLGAVSRADDMSGLGGGNSICSANVRPGEDLEVTWGNLAGAERRRREIFSTLSAHAACTVHGQALAPLPAPRVADVKVDDPFPRPGSAGVARALPSVGPALRDERRYCAPQNRVGARSLSAGWRYSSLC